MLELGSELGLFVTWSGVSDRAVNSVAAVKKSSSCPVDHLKQALFQLHFLESPGKIYALIFADQDGFNHSLALPGGWDLIDGHDGHCSRSNLA